MWKKYFLCIFLFCVLALGQSAVWAQGNVSGAPASLVQAGSVTVDGVFMENADFKEWLLADTNARISNVGIMVLVLFAVACLLFLASFYLLWRCCRHSANAKWFFDKFKMENCQSQGRFGMFIYDFRKERIQTSGMVCALLNIKGSGALPKDSYLRLMHQGQNITDYEHGRNTELIYERDTDIVFINLYTFPIMDKRGALLGEYGMLQDVSVFRRRELDYRMRRDAAKETFDSVDAYIMANPMHAMVLHDDFDILRMNKAAIDIVGADEDEFYSLCFKLLLEDNAMIIAFAGHLHRADEAGFAIGTFKLFNRERELVDVEIYTSRIRTIDHGDILCSSFRVFG